MNNKIFIAIVVLALLGILFLLRSRMHKGGRTSARDPQAASETQTPARAAKRAREECEYACVSTATRCNAEHSFDKTAQDRCDSAKASCVSKCR